jgi:hypothetical protein
MTERILGLAGDREPELVDAKLWAFASLLLLHATVRSGVWVFSWLDPRLTTAAAGLLLLCCVASFFSAGVTRIALRVGALVVLAQAVAAFPAPENHFFLELWLFLPLALLDLRQPADRALALQALQWLLVVTFFWSGLQKLLYGYYAGGEYLAFEIAHGDFFDELLGWLLPEAELARLRALDPLLEGAGPYRVDAPAFVALSNGVVLAELALPVLLLARRTRSAACLASIALVAGIQLAAREVMFALLFTNAALLFPRRPWLRWLLPVLVLVYVWAFGAFLGVLPGGSLLTPGHL